MALPRQLIRQALRSTLLWCCRNDRRGRAIWGERFELRLDQWFEVQQRIVRRMAATLNVQLSTERLVRMSHMPNVSAGSYDTWLRGQWVMRHFNAGEWNRAVRDVRAGDRAGAVLLAVLQRLGADEQSRCISCNPECSVILWRRREPLLVAQKAVTLDPLDSRAELCLGWALAMSRRYALAKIHMDLACELNTNDPWTSMSAAEFPRFLRRCGSGRELVGTGDGNGPGSNAGHWVYEASIRYLRGDDEGTIVAADRAENILLTLPAVAGGCFGQPRPCRGSAPTGRSNVSSGYSRELGSTTSPPTDRMIGQLVHASLSDQPFETMADLRDGLRGCGMPVDGLVHTGRRWRMITPGCRGASDPTAGLEALSRPFQAAVVKGVFADAVRMQFHDSRPDRSACGRGRQQRPVERP